MLGRLNQFVRAMFGSSEPQAAAKLTPIEDPKVPSKPQTQQSFSKRTKTSNGDQRLSEQDRRTANLDLLTLRNGLTTKQTIHDLAAVSPDLSGSVWAYQRMVVTRNFTSVARNLDGTTNPEATNALQQVLARFNYLTDYTDGFSAMSSIHTVAEALTKEFRMYGAGSLELVLDKARLPNRLQPVSTTQLQFYEDAKGYTYPIQKIGGNEINLDQPTFFYESIDQDLLQAYSDSPMEAALQATLADAEFTNDVRRVIKRALHPRLNATIDYEVFKKTIPPDVVGDPVKLRQYTDNFIAGISETVNGLEPDDALVSFDTTKFDYLNNGNVTLDKEYSTLQEMINAKLATGTKAPPAVLGHGSGSQNIASTETMLFIRYCEGIQNHINSLLSRALTLAVRLLGFDVFVEFAFERIDLRPDSELEAFRAMKQSRVLEQLSYGFITDEDAGLMLTGHLPPAGFKKLSGTQFTVTKVAADNPTSNTSNGNPQGPQDQRSQTPEQKKGPATVTRVK
jgi:hypothetical protein